MPQLENALKWIIEILNTHNIPYQISGGFAAHIYGSQRNVNDIDLDIPEDRMEELLDEIKEYITFGPEYTKDERWDLKLITLNYKGQEIDIAGAYEVKIFDDISKIWKPFPANLETAKNYKVFGINVKVVDPNDLIDYKQYLSGEHQKEDIEAVKSYIDSNNKSSLI